MPRIVISYRRADTGPIVGRIFDWLVERYGKDSVFIDVDNIPYGIDFRSHIHEMLLTTDLLIAAIGTNWLGRTAAGQTRMSEETDPVRVEIETALKRRIAILPVLIDGAKMPESEELPATFGDFAYLNAPVISSGRDFRAHMERLIAAIDRMAGQFGWAEPRRERKTDPVPEPDPAPSTMNWRVAAMRYFLVPLVALLVVHYAVVNAFNLNVFYLRLACVLFPLAGGFALFWIGRGGVLPALAGALALAIAGDVGMTVSESLYSGDPMLPQSRFEWIDNFQFAGTIALSFIVGHLAARGVRVVAHRSFGKTAPTKADSFARMD